MSTKELLQDRIFESGIKRRRTVFIIVILIILLLSIYVFNMYLYSYEERYSLSANEIFSKEIDVRGVPYLKMPITVFFQVSVQADIYLFSEEVYNRYCDKVDFPERYAEDAISFVLEKKKMEVKLARPPGKLYIVVKMPGLDKVVNKADASLYVEYKPLDPIYPLALLVEVIAIPLLILRIYILGQKMKQFRMQLTLDLDSLSDEDRVRLGLPPRGTPAPPPVKPVETPPPAPPPAVSPSEPSPLRTPDSASPQRSTATGKAKGASRKRGGGRGGYITPEEL